MARFFQGSKPRMVVLVFPVVAVLATLLQGPEALLIAITVLLYLIGSKLSSTQKLKEGSTAAEEEEGSPNDDVSAEEILTNSHEDSKKEDFEEEAPVPEKVRELEQSLTESEGNEDDDRCFSDIERRINNTSDDGTISDEESLIEIEIPSGNFISSPEKDPKNCCCCCCCCKLSQESIFLKKKVDLDFLADVEEMNEEDNLIEIDIYMGSIKCSRPMFFITAETIYEKEKLSQLLLLHKHTTTFIVLRRAGSRSSKEGNR